MLLFSMSLLISPMAQAAQLEVLAHKPELSA